MSPLMNNSQMIEQTVAPQYKACVTYFYKWVETGELTVSTVGVGTSSPVQTLTSDLSDAVLTFLATLEPSDVYSLLESSDKHSLQVTVYYRKKVMSKPDNHIPDEAMLAQQEQSLTARETV